MSKFEKLKTFFDSLPDDVQQETIKGFVQETCKKSLFHFARMICGYTEIDKIAHKPIIEALECKETNKKLIVVPRGCFKSSIASVAYPMWLLENNPNLRIMLDSELFSNSKNFLREIKTHYEKESFISIFGHRKADTWNESEIIIKSRNIPKKEPTIVCSGVEAQKTGQHYDVIIADDLNSPGNTKNPEVAETVKNHFRYYTSILDPGGILVVVATRYSELDVVQMILDNELGVSSELLLNPEKTGGLIGQNLCDRTS